MPDGDFEVLDGRRGAQQATQLDDGTASNPRFAYDAFDHKLSVIIRFVESISDWDISLQNGIFNLREK